MAQRRLVLMREDRLGHRLEQRHEALQSVGQRPGRDRQPLVGQPRGNAVQGPQAGTVLEQEACPEADPVGRVGEQPRHRGRRHFQGRRCAVAIPAPPGTDDPACVGLDFDLDDGRGTLAVRHVGLRATGTHARIGGRVVLFGALLEPGPLRAAMTGGAALLAALAPGAWLLLLLALAAVECLRQHAPSRAKPGKLPFQALGPGLRGLHRLAQPGDLHAQRHDRAALARLDAGLRKEFSQPRHFRLEEKRVLRRAPDLLRLLGGRLQLVPAGVELPLQRTRPGTGIHLRPAQFFRARLRRVRPRPLLLRAGMRLFVQRPPVGLLARRRRHGGRPDPVVPLGQRQGCPIILVAHRHALDDSRCRAVLPVPRARCPK